MNRPVRALASIAALAALIAAGPPVSAASAAPGQPGATTKATVDSQAGVAWVTLITGDRVAVKAGKPIAFDPADRSRPVRFAKFTQRGDWYVVPSDAASLVGRGTLDRQLFNVTGLVRQGYDDARTKVVPLLAEYKDARAGVAPKGARKARVVPGANLAVLEESKRDADTFWADLTNGSAAPRALDRGIGKVWLNARIQASLDKSVPQVGAPAAWQAGFTGKGVTVAVLDTGYDTDHPDLAGRIAATKNFTPGGTVEDKYGHGTHVSSIALGSGAASQGKYKGVAPDAKLAVGKVLDDSGSGQIDWIIAGMQWAATTAKAKVINMSLGGWPTDGTDPMSQAVNRISRQTGALFVIAAGNSGQDGTISTPAAADDALTVGSVTKTDQLSVFSSRGPRITDNAIKPDIAAPGSDIVAARATGTFPDEAVDENYARLSGTSMATPHVAGAAAILAQQHPDWKGDRIKAALMGTSKALAGLGPNAIGAGRLDLVRATTQPVHSVPGSVSAFLKWPNVAAPPQRKVVTYHNTSAAPVIVRLNLAMTDAAGKPAPAGLATLSTGSLTIPAKGQVAVTVTVKAVAGKVGNYAGILSATGLGGRTVVRTPFGVYQEPERYDLSVALKNQTGGVPAVTYVAVTDLDTGEVAFGETGTKVRLPRGRFTVTAGFLTDRPGLEPNMVLLSHPELQLARNTAITLDGRTAKRLSMRVDQPAASGGLVAVMHLIRASTGEFADVNMVDPRFSEIYAASTPGVRSANYTFGAWRNAEEPVIALTAEAPQRFPVETGWLAEDGPDFSGRLDAVNGGQGRPEDLAKIDAKGKIVMLGLPGDLSWEDLLQRLKNVKAAGGRYGYVIPLMPTSQIASELQARARRAAAEPPEPEPLPLPTFLGRSVTAERLLALTAQGTVTVDLATKQTSKHRYEVVATAPNSIPTALTFDRATKDLAAVRTRYLGHPGVDASRAVHPLTVVNGTVIDPMVFTFAKTGTERTEYFTPGTWIQESFGRVYGDNMVEGPRQLRVGGDHSLDWGKAVFTPTLRGEVTDDLGTHPWVHRTPSLLGVTIPFYSDAAGHTRLPYSDEYPDGEIVGDTGTTTLHRNGKLVGTINTPGQAIFPVIQSDALYTLSATSRRDNPAWPLATTTSAKWTFKSGAWDETPPPLLTVGLDPVLDVNNTAPSGETFSFPATVDRQAGQLGPMRLVVEVSYDDGKTWQLATVAGDGAKWKVTVNHPAAKGYVSLRAMAWESADNWVEQTVIRAYQLR